MNFDCIVTQVHIPEHDVQGGLPWAEKLKRVEFALTHLRHFNQNAYIIMTGHGRRPANLSLCNYHEWNDRHEPLDEHGYVAGMPAQFKYVWLGIDHAKRRGFTRLLKTRGDSIIGIPNITTHCQQILDSESKRLLITQQTGTGGNGRLGDCFMYGDTDLLWGTWHIDNPVTNHDGLQNTANNFRVALNKVSSDWFDLVKETCAFRDVDHLKFCCLRWNHSLSLPALLDPNFAFEGCHWGKSTGGHHFDVDRNMTGTATWAWSEKDFYGTSHP